MRLFSFKRGLFTSWWCNVIPGPVWPPKATEVMAGAMAGPLLDACAALAGAIAVGVLQDGQQGECIGAAHYRAGRAPGAAAGGGRHLVRRVLRSWPGPCMRLVLAPSRRRHGDVDPGECADVDQVDIVVGAIVGGVLPAGRLSKVTALVYIFVFFSWRLLYTQRAHHPPRSTTLYRVSHWCPFSHSNFPQ